MEEEFMIKMPVLEMFTTLNGEGQFSGKPVVFVRLVGQDAHESGKHWFKSSTNTRKGIQIIW